MRADEYTRLKVAGWLVALGLVTGMAGCGGGSDGNPEATPEEFIEAASEPQPELPVDVGGEPAPEVIPEAQPEEVTPPEWGDLAFNEVGCHDPDWLELINRGSQALDPAGWAVRDDNGEVYVIPAQSALPPGGFLVLKRQTPDEDGLTFGLQCGGDILDLLRPDGEVVDTVAPKPTGHAWGRLPDGSGEWGEVTPTPGEPNQPFTDQAAPLFREDAVITLDLGLSEDALKDLQAAPKEYTDATLTLTLDEGGQPLAPLAIGLRLKGSSSFTLIEDKASFKLKFDHSVDGQRLLGLRRLTLNSMVIDPSMMVEVLSYQLFRAFGVTAPRAGYAWVTLNGEPYGLFAVLEPYDEVFAANHATSTRHVYEGGGDLWPGVEQSYEVQAGPKGDRDDLTALIGAAQAPAEEWHQVITQVADLDQMVRMWAVELYINHWDGYAPAVNNFFLHSDSQGVFRMWPWGTDQTFGFWWGSQGETYGLHRQGGGVLYSSCLRDQQCALAYDLALQELLALADQLDLDGRAKALNSLIQPWVAQDTRAHYTPEQQAASAEEVRGFLERRRAEAGDLLACLALANPDADGDGYLCTLDCNEGDAAIHPGAAEVCGDGVDQDCSGYSDDGKDCDCQVALRGSQRYLLCPYGRPYADAVAHCQAQGSGMLVLNNPGEAAWLQQKAQAVGMGDWWIGLTDRQEEGVFAWEDGSPVDYTNWAPGEPNDSNGLEDCVQRAWDGHWMDVDCNSWLATVCEDPCPGPADADGDGFDACLDDCDDANPLVHPGALDECLDGLDQDCDGVTDNGQDCPDCRLFSWGSHRYLYCPNPLSWDQARAHCQELGQDLVIPDSPVERFFLSMVLTMNLQFYGEYWIGLGDQAEEGAFYWVDGSYADPAAWDGEGPDSGWGQGEEDCVASGSWGNWNDLGCDNPLPFVCEEDCAPADLDGDGVDVCAGDCDDSDPASHVGAVDLCGDGKDQDCNGVIDDNPACQWECVGLAILPDLAESFAYCTPRRPWEDARLACRALSGDLAWFDDAAQQAEVLATVAAYSAPLDVWIGLSDLVEEGQFSWTGGQSPGWSTWGEGQPNEGGAGQDCVRLQVDGSWNDTDCGMKYPALCRGTGLPMNTFPYKR
jgi:hypothetical protein